MFCWAGGELQGLLEGTVPLCMTWGSATEILTLVLHEGESLTTVSPGSCPSGQQSCLSSPSNTSLWDSLAKSLPAGPMLAVATVVTPSKMCSIFWSAPQALPVACRGDSVLLGTLWPSSCCCPMAGFQMHAYEQ